MPLVLKHINKLDNIRMIDLFENFNLVLHGSLILFTHLPFRQYLDGETLTCSSELSLLHGGKTTPPNRSLDLIGLFDVSKIATVLS